jgi:hypothetical protein
MLKGYEGNGYVYMITGASYRLADSVSWCLPIEDVFG